MTLQSDIIKYLSQPTAYSFKPDSVTVLETNMSYIFLTDKWVYKIKKEIVTQNADFSTPEKRKQACLQEMRRSAIYAPYLITALKPVHRLKNGRIKIGGKSGEEIDSVLVMKRIPDSALLKYILSEGVFGEAESAQLGKAIATLHLRAKSYHHFGTVAFLEKLIQSTEKTLLQYPTLFPAEKVKNISRFLWL